MVKNKLPDEFFSDHEHRNHVDSLLNQAIKRFPYMKQPYIWCCGADMDAQIMTRKGFIDFIAQTYAQEMDAEYLLLEFEGADSFSKAKENILARIEDVLQSARSVKKHVKSLKLKDID